MAIYIIEAALKIFFYRASYFSTNWNIFDFICLLGIVFFRILFSILNIQHNPVRILHTLFRVAKLLSLFRLLKILHRIFQITVLAFPSALNLAALIIIMNYIFAVIGVISFSTTKLQVDLDAHANFQNLLTGFLTAFRVASGDNWTAVIHDLMRGKTQFFDCIHYPTYNDIHSNGDKPNGCGGIDGVIFGILLILIVNFIFLNLFVAIVVASMLEITELSESVLSDEILDKYQKAWSIYDPDASGLLEYCHLWKFLCDLGKPLGVCTEEVPNSYYAAITLWMLELKIYYMEPKPIFCVEFYDVLEALVKKTIYRPQTLNKIFNNKCKEDLVDGLQEMWSQKSSLLVEDQEQLGKIEALSYYYMAKEASAKKGMQQLKKAQLPLLVWVTLRISRTLKLMVKKKKDKLLEKPRDGKLPVLDIEEKEYELHTSRVVDKPVGINLLNISNSDTEEHFESMTSNDRLRKEQTTINRDNILHSKRTTEKVSVYEVQEGSLNRNEELATHKLIKKGPLVCKEVKEVKVSKRLVEKKIPYQAQKVNIVTYTEQLNLQKLLHSLNTTTPRVSNKDETSGTFKGEINNSREKEGKPRNRALDDSDAFSSNRILVNKLITPYNNQKNMAIKFSRTLPKDDS